MDVFGNPENRDVFGNISSNDVHGNDLNGDVLGRPPHDVWGGRVLGHEMPEGVPQAPTLPSSIVEAPPAEP